MSSVILGCGLQNTYFNKDGSKYLGEKSEILKIRIGSYLKSLNKDRDRVYLLREIHRPDDKFFSGGITHSLAGTKDIEIPETFKANAKLIFNVSTYNAFYKTLLDSELNKIKPEKVVLVGVETHTTVLFTAEELRNRGYDTYVVEPLVSAEDEYLHAVGMTLLKNFLAVGVSEE